MKGFEILNQIYENRGFNIKVYHGGNEFGIQAMKTVLLLGQLLSCTWDKQVHVIEKSIIEIKERCKCICHSLPYTRYTRRMVISLAGVLIWWLNYFPSPNIFSNTMIPVVIVLGKQKIDINQKIITSRSYVMVYTVIKNTMKRNIVPTILLNESNECGGHNFMLLYSGKNICSDELEEPPIYEDVVDIVEHLAMEHKALVMDYFSPMFACIPEVKTGEISVFST